MLGRSYIGTELRKEQVIENRRQLKLLSPKWSIVPAPSWVLGDSRNFTKLTKGAKGDFIFSSPPYFGREPYSKLSEDLNNSDSYDEFLVGYRTIIQQAVSQLRDDRFACFEVAEIRDKRGIAPDFIGATVRAFVDAGAELYNHAIHLKPLASACIRAKMFANARKLVVVHEHDLVFVKGDPKRATQAIGDVQFGGEAGEEE